MEADYASTEMASNLNAPNQGRYIGDERMLVKFYLHAKRDAEASDEAGRPVFRDVEYVSIRAPGNKDSEIIRPARQMDKDRWPKHYAAFKSKEAMPVEGTPLSEWPALTRSQVETLRYMNVDTVEQLSDMTDVNAQGMMGASLLREKAKAFLAAAGDAAAAKKIEDALSSKDAQIAELTNMVENLKAAVESMQDKG
jgi:hypothetical protein